MVGIGKSSALCTPVMMVWSAAFCVDRSVGDVIDFHVIPTGCDNDGTVP